MTTSLAKPLLAYDTATPTARVGVLTPQGDCVVLRERTAARHSANLMALCDEVLREACVRVGDLAAIACGAGPGSFTGLRVGLAVAKGLALPTGLPLVLLSSLDAMAGDLAAQAPRARLLLPCLDAGKAQVYSRLYAASEAGPRPLGEADWVLSPEDLVRLVQAEVEGQAVCAGGNGLDRYRDVFAAALGEAAILPLAPGPSARSIGRLGLERLAAGQVDDIETAVPRYGRPPDITRPKKALLSP
jgi:tRNA threonylcarbamoyladenosine biosynthesis protein TsaB